MGFETYPPDVALARQFGLRGRLIAILEDLFQVPINPESGEVSRHELAAWDSFNHLRLILELEQSFGIILSDADTLQITSLSAIESLLKERGVVNS